MKFVSYRIFALIIVLFSTMALAGEKDFDEKFLEIAKPMDLTHRASGIHNGSNIGLFFENYGKFSHDDFSFRNSGEFPANSNHNYLYLMSTMVGVAPDAASGRSANVIQSRYATSTDWMPVGGYHEAPAADIAFSDNNATWPNSEWFFQDEEGDAVIISSQDSYCVYNDDGNQNEVLGIQVAQTGYSFGLPDYKDMIIFSFEVTNHSSASYDSVYFGLYFDFDIGDDAGGIIDYADDMLSFDPENDFIFVSDTDNKSIEWNSVPGIMGIALLESPTVNGVPAGITDMHYNRFYEDESIQMALMSSNLDYLPTGTALPDPFFYSGASPDIHFDDPAVILPHGADVRGTISSGPFDLTPIDTLTFIIGLIAGVNESDIYSNLGIAHQLLEDNFVVPDIPSSPLLSGVLGHNKVTLYWTNEFEDEIDKLSGAQDFEGYRLYKSLDHGMSWDQIDRNVVPDIGNEPVPFASFDRVNGWGPDEGLQYSYVDSQLIDGMDYWYSITAFDHGDSLLESLESPIGYSVQTGNVINLTPASAPSAYEPGKLSTLSHYGGKSTYTLNVTPASSTQLSDFTYDLHFLYALQNEIGNSGIWASIDIVDSTLVGTTNFGFEFTAADQIDITDIDTQVPVWRGGLYLGYAYPFPASNTQFTVTFYRADTLNSPSSGDLLSLNFCAELLRYDGQDTVTVIAPQRFDPGQNLVSDDGLILSLNAQPVIQDINVPPVLDYEIYLEVADNSAIQDLAYQITVTNSGIDPSGNIFIVVKTTDENASVLGAADTVYYGGGIQYNGWAAWFGFDPAYPPQPGTSTTFSTLPSISPMIQDYYRFGIIDGSTNEEMLADGLNNIRVVPNPYMAGSIWESEGGSFVREPVRQIQFTNLPMECEINIFTLAGDLIMTLNHDAAHGTETWDLRAEGGREIVSGIYLYQVKSAGFEYLNRFAVIK